MTWLPPQRYHAELVSSAVALAAVVRDAGPAHPVPTCPQWTMADLARHVGVALRWGAVMVRERVTAPPSQRADDTPPDAELATWITDTATVFDDAVREAGPDAAVWTWSTEQTAGFWLRRLTHDVLVHRLDAELAVGRSPLVAADLAAGGVSDLLACIAALSVSHADRVFGGLRGAGETLHFHATDDGLGEAGEWFVRRLPTGVEWEHGHRKGDVAVRAAALDLLLVLNRRTPPTPDRVTVIGDASLFAHWLTNSAF